LVWSWQKWPARPLCTLILEGKFWPNNKNKNRTTTINIEDLNNTHDNYSTTINSDSENSLDDILEDNQNTHLDYNLDNTLDDNSENNLGNNNQQSCRTKSRASSKDDLATYVPDTTTKRTSNVFPKRAPHLSERLTSAAKTPAQRQHAMS
jgi:hypothetical protein